MHTTFQRAHINIIKTRPDFAHFVEIMDGGVWHGYDKDRTAPDYAGPVLVLFYTQDNVLHAHKIGQRRLLQATSSR